MNEIFLSYASSDRPVASRVADALELLGWSVWWDREIPLGKNFDSVIEEQLKAARCVIVLWSAHSVQSRWVRAEASSAAARECLIPARIDKVAIPLEFTLIQAAELQDWDGDKTHPEFLRMVDAVRQMLGKPPAATAEVTRAVVQPQRARAWWKRPGRIAGIAAMIAFLLIGKAVVQWISSGASTKPDSAIPADPSKPDGGPPSDASTPYPPPEKATPIKIGDRIADGVPVDGAGTIESPHSYDFYRFEAKKGQRVYFHLIRHSKDMEQIRWRLVDPSGMEIFETCLGCGEPGVQLLRTGGTYVLAVGANNTPATGTYDLQLFDVPSPNQFPIKIGDKISDPMPGPGAGVIESPGAEDIYTFSAAPRQRVYFRMLEHSTGMEQIRWKLHDENGMDVFESCLGCGEPGAQTLIKGGMYTLVIGNERVPATGTYRVQLLNVPAPDQFSVKIGNRIRAGQPGPGAGVIESAGAKDIYQFNASPGQRVDFHLMDFGAGMDQNKWQLADENGMKIFDTCLACGQPGPQTLVNGGLYTLTVGSDTNPATGNYSFEIGAR